jgi:predicted nucleic acid-binding protein
MTIVDSSSWIEALRPTGDPAVRSRVESLLDSGNAAWCQMIRLELWRGVRGGPERRVLEVLDARLTRLEINESVWELAVSTMIKARASGLTVPSADALIVATARFHQARVEHCDRHLEAILNLV